MTRLAIALLPILLAGAADPPARRAVTAPNGVQVRVQPGDEFDGGVAFAGPDHMQRAEDGNGSEYTLVARKPRDALARHVWGIRGFVVYSGDLRFYQNARFKGGEEAALDVTQRKPLGCSAGVCHVAETFLVSFAAVDIDSHLDGDGLAVKVEARNGPALVLLIPRAEIEAVRAVMRDTNADGSSH